MADRRRPHGPLLERVLLGAARLSGLVVHGYVLDPEREGEALVVELLVDGVPQDLQRADLYDEDLAGEGARNAWHGFRFVLPQALAERGVVAEVRLANDGTLIGGGLPLAEAAWASAAPMPSGSVAWLGGLSFAGWIGQPGGTELSLRGLVDENLVVEARPQGWVQVDVGGAGIAVPAFEFKLPRRFADGRAHRLEVVTSAGETLPPGRVTFVAFEDGLEAFLAGHSDVAAEQVRGAFYDRLIPQSLPFQALPQWRGRFEEATDAPEPDKVVAVVVVGQDEVDATIDSLRTQSDLWVAGVMGTGEETAAFDPADLLAFLEADAAECDIVVFAAAGTAILPEALRRLTAPLLEDKASACVYGDVIVGGRDGRPTLPLALPAFDRERMIEQGYAADLFALSRTAALAAARAGCDTLYRLFLSASGIDGATRRLPLHVPGFAATVPPADPAAAAALLAAAHHLCSSLGIQADVQASAGTRLRPALRFRRRAAPCLVSVVIAARNDPADLRRCFAALKAQETVHDLEFIVVDNDSTGPEMRALLAEIASNGVQIVRVKGPRNTARSMNCGAAIASGAYLCFVDQHVAVSTPDAIEELLGRCSSHGTGAVGGLMSWPGGAVSDGGLVLDFATGVSRAFRGLAVDDPGYADLLMVAHDVSAVSAEFMMVGRDVLMEAGGLDEVLFPLFFPSVAFCMSAARLGHRTVLTPHARATWHGPADTVRRPDEQTARFERELVALRDRWPESLANDPCYSPILNREGRLYTGLAWPPRDMAVRRPASAARVRSTALPGAGGRRKQGESR